MISAETSRPPGRSNGSSIPLDEISHGHYPFTRYDRLYLPLVSAWFRALDKFT